MADGDVLTVDSAEPGGSGTIAGETKFKFAPPVTTPTGAAGGDLTGTYPNPTIAALAVTDAKVATANKDGTAGTPSMRTLGTGAQQACAGNDARLVQPVAMGGSFLSGVWYAPGPPYNVATGMLYNAPATNVLYAVPFLFGKAGTLTDVAAYNAGNGGSSTKTYYAIYRSNAARTGPGARIWSGEVVAINFANAKTEFNTLGLTVSADEILWFAAVSNGASSLGLTIASIYPLLGTNFDGTGGANPLRAFQVGYRAAFTYAQPPDPWTATGLLLNSADSGTGCPVCLFKFTPS